MIRDSRIRNRTRSAMLVVLAVLLGGCDSLSKSSLFQGFRRAPQPQDTTALSEQGIGKLAKGQFLQAQAIFDQALQKNPGDVHALLGKGIVYQQTGQLAQARSAYQAVLSLSPGNSQKMMIMSNLETRTVRDIASVNLAMLDSRGVSATLRGQQGQQGQQGQIAPQPAPPIARSQPQRPRTATPPAPVQSVSGQR